MLMSLRGMETEMLTVYMDRETVEFTLSVLQRAGYADEESQKAEMVLTAALSGRSEPHNPLKNFGHVEDHPHEEDDDKAYGQNAATDAEAAASIK